MKGNCLIAQSGGPTAVINQSLIGIVERALQSQKIERIYGGINGIYGLLHNEYIHLDELSHDKLLQVRNTPGAALGTWRYKLTAHDLERIVDYIVSREIRYFFYIGGNGSMKAASLIDQEAKRRGYPLAVIGVPKSIDNDLLNTDHSPGFGSAAKFLATCILDIEMDVKSLAKSNRVTIVEAMGRNTGWLAAACALVQQVSSDIPLLIYIPESAFSIEQFLAKVIETHSQYGYCLVVVSEGIRDEQGRLVGDEHAKLDPLGRPRLGGVSSYLTQVIEERTKLTARYVLPSVWQRSSIALCSKVDAEEAYRVGKQAVEHAEEGLSGTMVTIERCGGTAYDVVYGSIPLEAVASREKVVPTTWYDAQNCTMTEAFIDYVLPLIQGEVTIPTINGLPAYRHLLPVNQY
ncbi:6-phosphofructokinase [Brevibacillus humidisoli]|uniref:6-phosphofructokinase n=1 Tax=Brevibacillus humidisoli TaxID=2895522 RepID=UPI001E448086|nr:6-phosphofructokinase [Brevibacillus humidisoli]UFJ43364.1 6-phosphofructokinase [Brevibacillus humidisoli]